MALFDFMRNKIHYVQSFQDSENPNIRIYFNGKNEEQSNLNMIGYLGEEEYKNIRLSPDKYNYKVEKISEEKLKSMGINPQSTAHKICIASDDIKSELKKTISIENDIKKTKRTGRPQFSEPSIYEEKINDIKISSNEKNKGVSVNISDHQDNNKPQISSAVKTGKDIHIHINLGSSPHIEKALIDNEKAMKELKDEFSKSLNEARETISKMEERMNERDSEKNSFSSKFTSLSKPSSLSNAEKSFKNEKPFQFPQFREDFLKNLEKIKEKIPENKEKKQQNVDLKIDEKKISKESINNKAKEIEKLYQAQKQNSQIDLVVDTQSIFKEIFNQNPGEKTVENPKMELMVDTKKIIKEFMNEVKQKENLLSYKDAINLNNKENSLYFRGRYNEKDNIDGHNYNHVDKTSQKILGENYNKKIFSHEENKHYSIIKNVEADKIQNYIVDKNEIQNIMKDETAPGALKNILEKYQEKQNEKSLQNQISSKENSKEEPQMTL